MSNASTEIRATDLKKRMLAVYRAAILEHMTAKSKRILITTETREIVVVRFGNRQVIRYCGPHWKEGQDDRTDTPRKRRRFETDPIQRSEFEEQEYARTRK